MLISLLVLAVAGGCQSEGKSKTLKLGMLPIEDNFPFFVAEQEGIFQRHGLSVELVLFSSARDRDMAFQAGQIDGETADPVAVALLRKSGVRAKIISLTMGATPQEGRFAVLAAPKSRIKKAGDLVGSILAISENTIIEYVADQLLLASGVNPQDVKKLPVPDMLQRLQLLVNGQVDAAVLPDPLATLAEKQGAKVILDDTKTKENLSPVVLVFREEIIRSRQSDLARLLAAYQEAAAKVTADPRAYRELFVSRIRVPEPLKETYLAPKYSSPRLPEPQDLERMVNWMVSKGLLSEPYQYEDLVEEGVLQILTR
jgi:NitT/TauT family transport system substrate-binding protein